MRRHRSDGAIMITETATASTGRGRAAAGVGDGAGAGRRGGGRARRRGWRPWAAVVVTAAVVGAGSASAVGELSPLGQGPAPAPADTLAAGGPGAPGVHAALAEVLPGVVSIKTSRAGGMGTTAVGAGTGMILTPDGEVLTNAHVVAGAGAITVTRYGTTEALPAHLVGAAPGEDLALIEIEGASNLPTVTLGDSARVQVGDPVIAIGNALGLAGGTPTVTQGIISATGRSLAGGGAGGGAQASTGLSGMFQTDAAINPGNSGGPLVDLQGRVIGVNTAGSLGRPQAQDIGFAIPSGHATSLLPDLRRGGSVPGESAFLGVGAVTLTPSLRQAYGLVPGRGALVARVATGSPAARAGLAPGDVVVAMGGERVASAEDLAGVLRARHPGDTVRLDLARGSHQLSLPVTLTTQPGQ